MGGGLDPHTDRKTKMNEHDAAEKPERLKYVYVVEQGCYSSRGVVGVYATPQAAIEAHPVPVRRVVKGHATHEREGGWMPDTFSEPGFRWSNGLDWDDAAEITRYELEYGES